MTEDARVVLVSGGAYGIGRAVALGFAARGCRVTAFGVDAGQAEAARLLARDRGLTLTTATADVADADAVAALVDDVVAREGHIDVLVNNAAVRPTGSILDTSQEVWDRTVAVNLRGMFLLTKAALPHMLGRPGGVIINVASGAGHGRAGLFAYAVSKGAVFPFTASLALDLAPHGIRVNTVVPGSTLTGMTENWGPSLAERARTRSVAGRLNTPEDIAQAIIWLASPEASVISGATLEVGTLPRSNA